MLTEIDDDLVKATIKGFNSSIIMWLINRKPRTRYEIQKEIRRLTGSSVHEDVICPLLYELEEKSLLTSVTSIKGKRRRIKYYHITNEGKEVLEALRSVFEKLVKDVLKDLLGERIR